MALNAKFYLRKEYFAKRQRDKDAMIIRLAPALKRDFKAKLAFEGKTAQETLEHLIMGYMLR